MIGGVAAAGGFGLIAVAALAVLAVKYRIARRFMSRNKVGDLYTTQDEQCDCCNVDEVYTIRCEWNCKMDFESNGFFRFQELSLQESTVP